MIEHLVNQYIIPFTWRLFSSKKDAMDVAHFLCEFVYILVNSWVFFDYSICGDQGTPFEHLEGILSVIREVYKERKNKLDE